MSTPSAGSSRQFKVPLRKTWLRQRPRRKAKARSYEDQPPKPRMLQSPRPKAVAPYTAWSELEDSQLRFLIYHYVTIVTGQSVVNVGPRFEWYPLAVRDDAFFHAVISSTCSHFSYLTGVDLPWKWIFFRHRGLAIRIVNERIARGAHDEGTINSVVVFAQQESFEGNPQAAKTHIEGLLQILRAAGGAQSPNLSEKTRRHIYLQVFPSETWTNADHSSVDLAACISLNARPLLPSPLNLLNLEPYFLEASHATASYTKTFGTRLYNYTGSPLSDVAANVLWGMRNISEILEAFKAGKATLDTQSASDIQFSDRVEVLERLIHQLWYIENPQYLQHAIFRSFGATCLVYLYATFRELPKELGVARLLASRVKIALETCGDLNVLLATFPELMLWQMFICGRIADERDRPFLAQQATKILRVKKLEESSDILAAADKFLWPERDTEPLLAPAGGIHALMAG